MITTEVVFGITCDTCKEHYGSDEDYQFFTDKTDAEEAIKNDGWHIAHDGKTHCPNCFHIDQEEVILHVAV